MKWTKRIELTEAEELTLIGLAKEGDQNARNKLVESHLPFIRSQAKLRRCPPWLEPEDLVQAAVIGFIRAIEKWLPDKNCRLLGYGKWWIRNALDKEIEFSKSYRVPSSVAFIIKTGWKNHKVKEKTRLAVANFREMTLFSEQDPADLQRVVDPKTSVEEKERIEHLHYFINQLSAKHQRVIHLRMAEMTLSFIGRTLGLGTAENVRLIEEDAHQALGELMIKSRKQQEIQRIRRCLEKVA